MGSNRVRIPACVHHKPTGQARVRIDGRDFYLGRYGSLDADEAYRRIVAEWIANGTVEKVSSSSDLASSRSINELILAYYKFAEGYYVKNGEPTSELNLIRDTMRVLREHYGSTSAADFSPLKLKAVREVMVARKWVRSEVNRKVGRIRRMFKWAVENELVVPSVLHGLQAIAGLRRGRSEAVESQPVMPVAENDINAVLPLVSRQVRDMIRLQLLAGCRPGEICMLRPSDVNRDGDVWEYQPESHKTEHHGRERKIFLGPKAQQILAPWLENRPAKSYCFVPREAHAERMEAIKAASSRKPAKAPKKPRRKGPRTRIPGECFTTGTYSQSILETCRKAGITPWSPNQLRHSRATWLRRQYGLEAAQVVLGHSSANVTQVYAERDFDTARRVMAEVG